MSELTGDWRRGPEGSEGPPLGVRVERAVRPHRAHNSRVIHVLTKESAISNALSRSRSGTHQSCLISSSSRDSTLAACTPTIPPSGGSIQIWQHSASLSEV